MKKYLNLQKQKNEIREIKELTDALEKSILTFYNLNFPKSKWSHKKLRSFFTKKTRSHCFVIEKNNQIGGLILGKADAKNPELMLLETLLIRDDLRGQGYAKLLVTTFLREAFKSGSFDSVGLHFRQSNNLQNFYEKLGFVKQDMESSYKNGEQKHYMKISRDDIMQVKLS